MTKAEFDAQGLALKVSFKKGVEAAVPGVEVIQDSIAAADAARRRLSEQAWNFLTLPQEERRRLAATSAIHVTFEVAKQIGTESAANTFSSMKSDLATKVQTGAVSQAVKTSVAANTTAAVSLEQTPAMKTKFKPPATYTASGCSGDYVEKPTDLFTADCSMAVTNGAKCVVNANKGYMQGSVTCNSATGVYTSVPAVQNLALLEDDDPGAVIWTPLRVILIILVVVQFLALTYMIYHKYIAKDKFLHMGDDFKNLHFQNYMQQAFHEHQNMNPFHQQVVQSQMQPGMADHPAGRTALPLQNNKPAVTELPQIISALGGQQGGPGGPPGPSAGEYKEQLPMEAQQGPGAYNAGTGQLAWNAGGSGGPGARKIPQGTPP
jgi:hypothetical protein